MRDGLALEAGRVRLAKYGWVRIAAPCAAQAKLRRLLRRGHATLQHITVTKHSGGHWYATVNFTREATANLLRNRSLAAAIGDQGWAELARQLTYKTARSGGQCIVGDRWFASSKTCSACGAVRPKLTLAERTYRCDACGLICDRDVNAAANLAAWGEHTLGICPCGTQAGDRHPGGPSAEPVRHACGGWVSGAAVPAAAVPPGEAGTSRPRTRVA